MHNCIPFDRLVNDEDTIGVDAEELVNLEVLYNVPFKYHFIKPPQHLFFVCSYSAAFACLKQLLTANLWCSALQKIMRLII